MTDQEFNDKKDNQELQKADQQLADVKDFLFSVIGNAPVGILTLNTQKTITVCNQEFVALFNKAAPIEDIINQPIGVVLNDLPILLKTLDEFYKKGMKSFNMPKVQYGDIFLRIRARKLNDGMLLFFDDITPMVQAEHGLADQLEQQKDIDQMKTDFVSVASHQLRTPLTAIKLFSKMLIDDEGAGLTEKQQNCVTNIHESTERMVKLVNELLNIGRLEEGRIVIDPHLVQVEDLIQTVIEEEMPLAQERGCKLIFNKPEELLPKLNLDESLAMQLLHNLISNAIKYSSKEEAEVLIEAHLEAKTHVVISIKDNGIGIAGEDKPKIFTKFFRAKNAVLSETDGTGLGLYLCKVIVDAFGGEICFDSIRDEGTTFYLKFPLKENADIK